MRGAIAAAVYENNSSYVVEREAAQTRGGGVEGRPRVLKMEGELRRYVPAKSCQT